MFKKKIYWGDVDWTKQNCIIAEEKGVTGEAVRLVRKKLAKPDPENKRKRRSYKGVEDFIKNNKERFSNMNRDQASNELKAFGYAILSVSVFQFLDRHGVKPRKKTKSERNHHKKKIYTDRGEVFDSMREASHALGSKHRHTLSLYIKQGRNTYKGVKFSKTPIPGIDYKSWEE